LVPTVALALLIRLEAVFIGPYWAWVELIPFNGEDGVRTAGPRQKALIRRVALPGGVAFGLVAIWPSVYGLLDAVAVGMAAAGLLLWPLIFHGLPYVLRGKWAILFYGSLLGAFASAAALGAYMAGFARADDGVLSFLQENAFGFIIGGLVTVYFTSLATRSSTAASRDND